MSRRPATVFCKHVENRLGWRPPKAPDRYKYMQESARVEQRIADDPALFTYANLKIAVELLARERKACSPSGVFFHVSRALNVVRDREMDLNIDVREVMAIEAAKGDPDGWVERLSRAFGSYRSEALDEWRKTHA